MGNVKIVSGINAIRDNSRTGVRCPTCHGYMELSRRSDGTVAWLCDVCWEWIDAEAREGSIMAISGVDEAIDQCPVGAFGRD